MKNPEFSLKEILSTFTSSSGKKLMIFNSAPIGGLSNIVYILFFISLPVIEYFVVFNQYVFDKLGIATCIVLYIVLSSILMMVVAAITWKLKKSVVKKITPSWNSYFKEIDLEMVVSSGITPYNNFFDYYSKAIKEGVNEDNLHKYLQDSFKEMQIENKDLIEALKRDKKNI
ncbi:hypothetical protein GJV85_12015 [Sulfurimonas aquatica]|uniref:Uncharacterized protein n=1 Tax=Sulfurimonas aquatica TaxID=2672570 RepID=A0A975B266_9BACT|nr:hypothetical protein [Sulfurimonas aquatica]QSZ42809.1 hypothetical protein GJV85_12015 [Sulfurimonas aquatica]